MNEVGDIGMPQLMWSYLKVQTISNLTVMRRLFSKNRSNRMFHALPIFVSVIILPAFGKVGFITPDAIRITGFCRRLHFLTGFCGCFALVFTLFSQLPGSFRVSPGKLNQCIVFSLAFGCQCAGIMPFCKE